VAAALIDVMAALVSGPQGAAFVIYQMEKAVLQPGMEMLTWRQVFNVIAVYCDRFKQATMANPGGASGLEGVMNRGDALGLVAYLKLFT
jgi:hypothetical protein